MSDLPRPLDERRSPTWSEQLSVPWSWWPIGLGVVAVLAGEAEQGGMSTTAIVALYAGSLGLVLAVLAVLSRFRLKVRGGVLHVPGARAPVSAFGSVEPLDRTALRQWLGPRAQRWAFVAVRPWIGTGVRLSISDPEDDTPYWVVGTRHPERLVAAVEQARRG